MKLVVCTCILFKFQADFQTPIESAPCRLCEYYQMRAPLSLPIFSRRRRRRGSFEWSCGIITHA